LGDCFQGEGPHAVVDVDFDAGLEGKIPINKNRERGEGGGEWLAERMEGGKEGGREAGRERGVALSIPQLFG